MLYYEQLLCKALLEKKITIEVASFNRRISAHIISSKYTIAQSISISILCSLTQDVDNYSIKRGQSA